MPSSAQDYDQAREFTAASLLKIIETTEQLSHLSLPERKALIEEISRVIPAGNVPGLVAAGLATLPDRAVPIDATRRNLTLLMQGMQTFLDRAVYTTFFQGPASILNAYQKLLKLAGKDLDKSFPEGTWQFYVEFGVREDSGRHACETVGFQETIKREGLRLGNADEMAAWVAASAWLLDRYPALLTNEWHEHTRLHHLATKIPGIAARWRKVRPFSSPVGTMVDFTEYRRTAFELFCNEELTNAKHVSRHDIEKVWNDKQAVAQRAADLEAYQRQMSIQAVLNPTEHNDVRMLIPREKLCIAVIQGGRYYLINFNAASSVESARSICGAIVRSKPTIQPTSIDRALCTAYRRDQAALRRQLPESVKNELKRLRMAPIILNWDQVSADQPLADIRSGRRGIGDHALTVFRTSRSIAFDLSHIFFDGPWGMAVAEILTSQAARFARQLNASSRPTELNRFTCLNLETPNPVLAQVRKSHLPSEVSAETSLLRMDLVQGARRSLYKRNKDLSLTFNDMLVLYRSLFGPTYQPSSELMGELAALHASSEPRVQRAAELALESIEIARQQSPALLIPVDASGVQPRQRLYPMTFRNPFTDILTKRQNVLAAQDKMDSARVIQRTTGLRQFDAARGEYLLAIHFFGQLIKRYKDVTLMGESVSTATIKLLAGLPSGIQRLLDKLPSHFDILNDVVKGQEVFSNVGQVAATSSLTRFNTAKDDNEKKILAWGIITDATGTVRLSLRDVRPHVPALISVKQEALAQRMTQEYLDSYAMGLNTFAEELMQITRIRS